ncbi:phosphatidylinositol alpha 1,6-mannosyltransferase [Nocardioides luteus]|uniref:GDP-mannose-dependent alpha-mannosyltransferase n=1 Tax=Nocardioides luteus TaxID=1844 RepID=A0ABQ5SSX6_9ACTN|nr:glycosyltransferase family 1 protein [Nocardioides luteus]MDR7309850.1 phosphatidylinositol alpha 1,6-mannosyltransferase [Nocardioides luteus]GGR73076.1 GDP-mannose-dependent alpha-mannosyltransferase [Nocardioides luteus]GLJ67242.1 GDP-mannose-dependent alpha-mannosyltransferase [Nocardioides luteus]
MSISLDRAPLVAASSEPLRILVVTESFLPQINGVTNSVRHVLDHLAADGHTVEVVAPTGPDEYAGFPVTRTRGARLWVYQDFRIGLETRRKLRAVMRRFRPDVVHVASPALLGRQAVLVAGSLGIPTVAIYQTDLVGFWDKYKALGGPQAAAMLTRQAHAAADRTLAPSSSSLTQLEGLGVQRTGLWPRGVDVELFHPSRIDHDLRARLAPCGELILGYVGRLAQEKELHLLASLARDPAYSVVLVGGGKQERELRRLLPNATFLGVLQGEELGAAYASLDVFVHTGSHETFCQAVQEALASGLPVVAPRSGGPVDLVDHGVTGFLYEPGSRDDLARYVARLRHDPQRRLRMGREARRSVAHKSWGAVNAALLDHYRDVIGSRRSR